MNIWKCNKWKEIYEGYEIRSGLRLRFQEGVDQDVKETLKDFCKWIRNEYVFPIRVSIYVKNALKIKARDGDLVYGTFFGPYNMIEEPYIRISAGDYCQEKAKGGKREALVSYLYVVAHELSHYFQWINQLELTEIGKERQATRCADTIVQDYTYTKNKEKYEFLERMENKAYEKGLRDNELRRLEELSYDENPQIRGIIAEILINSEREKAEEILMRLAGDKDSLIRAEACYSLGISKSAVIYEMLKNIAEKDRHSTVRGYAILSLENIAVEIDRKNDIIQFLEDRLIHEKVVFTKIYIYAVLYNLGVTTHLDDILAMINTKSYQNRRIIVEYLFDIVNNDNKEIIAQALSEQKKNEKCRSVIIAINEVLDKIQITKEGE